METSEFKQSDVNEIKRHGVNNSNGSHFAYVIFLSILIILAAIISSLDFIIGYVIHHDVTYNLPLLSKTRLEELEVLCDDLSLSPDEDQETFRPGTNQFSVSVNSEGKYVCRSRNNPGELASKVIERNLRLQLAKGMEQGRYLSCGNRSLAPKSGHLTTTFSQISRNELQQGNGTETVLHWEAQNKTGNSSDDSITSYSNAEIIVHTGQTYLVYASVHVNISRKLEKFLDKKYKRRTFTIKVCKKRYGYEQILLGETKIFDSEFEADVVSSVKVMGQVHLSKNESIYVKVSNADYVISVSKGNTFGIFPL